MLGLLSRERFAGRGRMRMLIEEGEGGVGPGLAQTVFTILLGRLW